MSAHSLFCYAFTVIIFFMLPNLSIADDIFVRSPILSFGWADKRDFQAGETAAIRITILKEFKTHEDKLSFSPNVSMNDVMGNSSIITNLRFDRNDWRIYFVPILVGTFNVLITETRFNIMDPSMYYVVTAGPLYELCGVISWMNEMDDYVAGSKATALLFPKDAFGNNVTQQSGFNFQIFATDINGSRIDLWEISYRGWKEFGYLFIEFVAVTSGQLLVHIKHRNIPLINSPLPLTVHPGPLAVGNCLPYWSHETEFFQVFSTMETFISQRDKLGNLVPGLYEFDFEFVEKWTNMSSPIGDLQHKEVSPGIQSFSFRLIKPGDFILIISDKHKTNIAMMPWEVNVYIGYCDDQQSVVNGSGLAPSVAGEVCKISVSLKDAYQYPSPVETQRIQVQITAPLLLLNIFAEVYPKDYSNGTQPPGMLNYGTFGPTGMTYDPAVFSHDNSVKDSMTKSSDFEIVFVPEKSGVYEIRIFSGNIQLNGGQPFIKEVSPGEVNVSLTKFSNFDKIGQSGILNYFSLKLVDSFDNPISFQEEKLHMKMYPTTPNATYYACDFHEISNGTYQGCYNASTPKFYEFLIAYSGQHIQPWPYQVEVIDNLKFPLVRNDTVNVWEDQSTSFYPLENDYFVGDVKVLKYERANHGSVLLYGTLFRYTPYKGFYGFDKFFYTISDSNGHNATGHVDINILTIPPQFVSSPPQLQAVEDTLSPQFGGFPSFEILYSDPLENISIMFTAQNGTVILSPILMQLWDPKWNQLSVSYNSKRLNITGRLEVINFALKSLKYIGNADFSGDDVIAITTINGNDKGYLDIPIFVKPVNDPPVINVPEFIILENVMENKGFLIFDRKRDEFNFSVEDPDRFSFPENETLFRVMFSVEVSSGTFSAKLPAQLISTTELKFKISKQWQPLATFVEIEKHFTVNKVKGLRFRGTINECNSLLHQLIYYSDKQDAVIKLIVNDMGLHGCYPDCSEMMSSPLISKATVNLITRTPMNSFVAHSLGSVLMIESILITLFVLILTFCTCKCVFVLLHDKRKRTQNLQLGDVQNSPKDMPRAGSPDNTTQQPDEEANAAEVLEIN